MLQQMHSEMRHVSLKQPGQFDLCRGGGVRQDDGRWSTARVSDAGLASCLMVNGLSP